MPACEMCGKEEEVLAQSVIEGSMLSVCSTCAKFGIVVKKPEPSVKEVAEPKKVIFVEEKGPLEVIVPDFAEKVKKAREKMELTQEKLGTAIAEKESVIHKIESGHMTPSLKLARKFEQFLHINLITEYKESEEKKELNFKDTALTIGDLLKLK